MNLFLSTLNTDIKDSSIKLGRRWNVAMTAKLVIWCVVCYALYDLSSILALRDKCHCKTIKHTHAHELQSNSQHVDYIIMNKSSNGTYFSLITVGIRLVGTIDGDANILGLFRRQYRQLSTKRL